MSDSSAPRRRSSTLSRRGVLRHGTLAAASLMALPAFAAPSAGSGRGPIRVGCTSDMTSPERVNADLTHEGAAVAFETVNRAGGIDGRKIEIVRADDKFNPDLAKQNALNFIADPSVVAMIHPLGTRQAAAVMTTVKDMAVVGPNTGTSSLRSMPSENTFFVRADYDQEVFRLIQNALTLGMTRFAVVAPKDPLGESVLKGVDAACKALNVTPTTVAYTPDIRSPEVKPAAIQVAKANVQLVLVILATTAPFFIKELRDLGNSATVYGLSIASSQTVLDRMGANARGFGFAMVVPSPHQNKYGVVRSYQADMRAAGSSNFSLPSLEGYINGRVLLEGMRRAPGGHVTREGIIAGLRRIDALDLGGFRLGYADSRRGSKFVDIGVAGTAGRILS